MSMNEHKSFAAGAIALRVGALVVAVFALSLGLSSPSRAQGKTLHRAFTECSYCECQNSSPMQVSIPAGHIFITLHIKNWSATNIFGYPEWVSYNGLGEDGTTWSGWSFPIGAALPLLKGVKSTITPENPKSGDEVWFREEYVTPKPVVLQAMLSSIHWHNGAGACFQIASEHWLTIDTSAGQNGGVTAAGSPVTPGPSVTNTQQIADNWNTGGCGLTDRVTLSLNKPTHLDRVDLWYHWGPNETSVPYSLIHNGQIVSNGTLIRAECDRYQAAWCVARGQLGSDLAAGVYTFRTQRAAVCQNAGSGGQGFVRAYGSNASSAASTGH